jgi:hypothetical protein
MPRVLDVIGLLACAACHRSTHDRPESRDAAPPQAPSSVASTLPDATVATAAPPHPDAGPGIISCGDSSCEAKREACCVFFGAVDRYQCSPRDDQAHCGTSESHWKTCEKVTDCNAGEVCCYVPRTSQEIDAVNICRPKCGRDEVEACAAGSACRFGKKCSVSTTGLRLGLCVR